MTSRDVGCIHNSAFRVAWWWEHMNTPGDKAFEASRDASKITVCVCCLGPAPAEQPDHLGPYCAPCSGSLRPEIAASARS